MRFLPQLHVVTLLVCIGCAPRPAPLDEPAPVAGSCAALSSGDLEISGLESEPGYDEALAALDLAALPSSIPLVAEGLQREIVLYMLDEPDREITALDRDATLAKGELGRAVLGAFAIDDGLDFAFLRRGLHRFYACDRGFPATLAEFNETVVDTSALAPGETVDSAVKGLPRRLSRSASAGIFMAETLVDIAGEERVRETEILLTDRRQDGAIEFLEYDADGVLRGASSFATSTGGESTGAVPFSCMACHGTRNVTPEL